MRLVVHLFRGLLIARFRFPGWDDAQRRAAVRRWSSELLAILHLRLTVHGALSDVGRPVMLVANHVSWLDIFAIDAIVPIRFVAKSEIRGWPLIGWLCEQAGTVFIRQARRQDTLRVNETVGGALAAGEVFAVFPEGTTTDGAALLKFHSSLIEPALRAAAQVQPVALRYTRLDGTLCKAVSYAGERSLWDTVVDMSAEPAIDVEVFFLPPVESAGRHRRDVARDAEAAIRTTLYP